VELRALTKVKNWSSYFCAPPKGRVYLPVGASPLGLRQWPGLEDLAGQAVAAWPRNNSEVDSLDSAHFIRRKQPLDPILEEEEGPESGAPSTSPLEIPTIEEVRTHRFTVRAEKKINDIRLRWDADPFKGIPESQHFGRSFKITGAARIKELHEFMMLPFESAFQRQEDFETLAKQNDAELNEWQSMAEHSFELVRPRLALEASLKERKPTNQPEGNNAALDPIMLSKEFNEYSNLANRFWDLYKHILDGIAPATTDHSDVYDAGSILKENASVVSEDESLQGNLQGAAGGRSLPVSTPLAQKLSPSTGVAFPSAGESLETAETRLEKLDRISRSKSTGETGSEPEIPEAMNTIESSATTATFTPVRSGSVRLYDPTRARLGADVVEEDKEYSFPRVEKLPASSEGCSRETTSLRILDRTSSRNASELSKKVQNADALTLSGRPEDQLSASPEALVSAAFQRNIEEADSNNFGDARRNVILTQYPIADNRPPDRRKSVEGIVEGERLARSDANVGAENLNQREHSSGKTAVLRRFVAKKKNIPGVRRAIELYAKRPWHRTERAGELSMQPGPGSIPMSTQEAGEDGRLPEQESPKRAATEPFPTPTLEERLEENALYRDFLAARTELDILKLKRDSEIDMAKTRVEIARIALEKEEMLARKDPRTVLPAAVNG
jgi:hypothetical protein